MKTGVSDIARPNFDSMARQGTFKRPAALPGTTENPNVPKTYKTQGVGEIEVEYKTVDVAASNVSKGRLPGTATTASQLQGVQTPKFALPQGRTQSLRQRISQMQGANISRSAQRSYDNTAYGAGMGFGGAVSEGVYINNEVGLIKGKMMEEDAKALGTTKEKLEQDFNQWKKDNGANYLGSELNNVREADLYDSYRQYRNARRYNDAFDKQWNKYNNRPEQQYKYSSPYLEKYKKYDQENREIEKNQNKVDTGIQDLYERAQREGKNIVYGPDGPELAEPGSSNGIPGIQTSNTDGFNPLNAPSDSSEYDYTADSTPNITGGFAIRVTGTYETRLLSGIWEVTQTGSATGNILNQEGTLLGINVIDSPPFPGLPQAYGGKAIQVYWRDPSGQVRGYTSGGYGASTDGSSRNAQITPIAIDWRERPTPLKPRQPNPAPNRNPFPTLPNGQPDLGSNPNPQTNNPTSPNWTNPTSPSLSPSLSPSNNPESFFPATPSMDPFGDLDLSPYLDPSNFPSPFPDMDLNLAPSPAGVPNANKNSSNNPSGQTYTGTFTEVDPTGETQPNPQPNQNQQQTQPGRLKQCEDPCINKLLNSNDDKEEKEKEKEKEEKSNRLKVKVFKACATDKDKRNVEDGVVYEIKELEVRQQDREWLKWHFDTMFELAKEKCGDKFVIPETMALRVPDGRPVLTITYRKVKQGKQSESRWNLKIPWFKGAQHNIPKASYKHGNTRVTFKFRDGSNIIVNAANEREGKRQVAQFLKQVMPEKIKGGHYVISRNDRKDTRLSEEILEPISAAYYSTGDGRVNGLRKNPDWRVRLRK
jgi:hypothetical protein